MRKPVDPLKIKQFESMREPMDLQAVIKESNRCLLCFDAPCSSACPAGTDPAKFIRQIKFYNYKGAARTIRGNNILGSVCAFICPVDKLCEKQCSLKALEDPIDIKGLQRFASEYGRQSVLEPLPESLKTSGRVAIIGCGPAGMGCASALATLDYDVTIFEREDNAGGVTHWNIPEFRLPADALGYDVSNLLNQGVEIRYNSTAASTESIVGLLAQGYDSVFISSGLTEPFTLPFLESFPNAVDYISFLRQVKFDKESIDLKNKNVAVIGGGSVAIDSAVSAKACGANKVYLISLEHLDELPADSEEINLAHTMNIIFKAGSQITGVVQDGTKITGLTGTETEWAEPGKFSPSNALQVQGTEFRLNVDLVIQAIGTSPGRELPGFAEGLITKGKGVIDVDSGFGTSIPGVFAGGDVTNGGATVVQAVGEGKKAAAFIDNYIVGRNRK